MGNFMNHSSKLSEVIPRYKILNWIVLDYISKFQARDSKLKSLFKVIYVTRIS